MKALLAAAFVTATLILSSAVEARVQPMQVGAAVRAIDDLIEWAVKMRKALPEPHMADDAIDALRGVAKTGDDVAPEVVELFKRDFHKVRPGAIDPQFIRMMSRAPAVRDAVWDIALKVPAKGTGQVLASLVDDLGPRAPSVLSRISTQLSSEEAAVLIRGLTPRLLSQDRVQELKKVFQRVDMASIDQGELFEAVARAQISGGALKAKNGLKEGARVVKGQHNSRHGIDGIGAGPEGRPVIFEFSMYERKVLDADANGLTQLSPEWVADRWNKMIAAAPAGRIEELNRLGIDEQWLKPTSAKEVLTWSRKLVVADESALTDANRLAAKLGPDDLLVLGKN
jgi:hypothetical protein